MTDHEMRIATVRYMIQRLMEEAYPYHLSDVRVALEDDRFEILLLRRILGPTDLFRSQWIRHRFSAVAKDTELLSGRIRAQFGIMDYLEETTLGLN